MLGWDTHVRGGTHVRVGHSFWGGALMLGWGTHVRVGHSC